MSATNAPTLASFQTFVADIMRIDPIYLPTNDPLIGYAFNVAMAIVNPALAAIPTVVGTWSIYALAVFNLAASTILNFAQDQTGRTYFTDLRKEMGMTNFSAGVITSSSDQGTSQSTLNPEFMKTLTLQNLQALNDPYGRQYLMFAQAYGSLWGLTV